MLITLWNLAAFIITLSILISIHEFGHFIVARLCGVKVHRFSIGFGKVLFKRTDRHGTQFAIAAIPLGGYVKMLDGREDKLTPELEKFAFDKKSVWQRISIVAAGPIANFFLAIIAFALMFMIGVNSGKPIIQEISPNSPMSSIDTLDRFQILSVNGQETKDWEALNMALVSQIGNKDFLVTINALNENTNNKLFNGEETAKKSFTISLDGWKFEPKKSSIITSLGLIPYRPKIYLQIATIVPNGAADRAGLQAGDKLLSVNGVNLVDWMQFVKLIQQNPNSSMQVLIERGTIDKILTLTPKLRKISSGAKQGFIGVTPVIDEYPSEYLVKLKFNFLQAIDKGFERTAQLTELTYQTLVKLVTGDISVKNLSGPISIAKGAGMSADYGIEYFLGFIALISVNLGLMNLVPLPVLDGGHLLFYFFEVLTGKPIPVKIQEVGFRIGGAILFALMAIAILNDFNLL